WRKPPAVRRECCFIIPPESFHSASCWASSLPPSFLKPSLLFFFLLRPGSKVSVAGSGSFSSLEFSRQSPRIFPTGTGMASLPDTPLPTCPLRLLVFSTSDWSLPCGSKTDRRDLRPVEWFVSH